MEITKGIFLSICCSFVAVVLHLAISRLRKGRQVEEPVIFELKRQAKAVLAIWVLVFILYAYLFFVAPGWVIRLSSRLQQAGESTGYIYGFILYLAACFIYLSFYYLVDRSVSATLLEIIDKSCEDGLKQQQIKKIYGVENKYRSELKGMLDGGFIKEEGGYYSNSLKGRLYARGAWAIKAIFKLGPGG